MKYLAGFDGDQGLRAFVQELVDDDSLMPGADELARKLLEQGLDAMHPTEIAFIEEEVIAPYCGPCEDCGKLPKWDAMLHTYDTGLCPRCFQKEIKQQPPTLESLWPAPQPVAVPEEPAPGDPNPAAA